MTMATKKKPEPDVIDVTGTPIPEPVHEPLPDPEPEPPTLFDTLAPGSGTDCDDTPESIANLGKNMAESVAPIEGTGVRVYPAVRPAMMAHSTPVEPPAPMPVPAPATPPAPAPPAPAPPAPAPEPAAPTPTLPAPNFASAEVVRLVLVIANTPPTAPTVAELGQVMEWTAPSCCEAIATVMRGKIPFPAKIVALRASQSVSAIVYTAKV